MGMVGASLQVPQRRRRRVQEEPAPHQRPALRAAKLVRVGDEISIREGLLTRIFEVKGILKRRVGAKEVPAFLTDRTPAEEYERVAALEKAARESTPVRESGTGRPTKRDRRELEEIGGSAGTEEPTFEEFVKAFLKRRPLR